MKQNCMDRNDVAVVRHEKVNSIILFIIGIIFIALYTFLKMMLLCLIIGIVAIIVGILLYRIKTTLYLKWIDEGVVIVEETGFTDKISYELKLNELKYNLINDEILEIRDEKNHLIRIEKNSDVFCRFQEQLEKNKK